MLDATLGKGEGFQGDGAGAGSGNTIQDTVASYVKDRDAADAIATSVTAAGGAASIGTLDLSSILADAGGLALALSLGDSPDAGAVVSIGISVALNTISDTDEAFIDTRTVSGQSVAVTSTSDATIDALTLAGALDVHINNESGLGLDLTEHGPARRTSSTNGVGLPSRATPRDRPGRPGDGRRSHGRGRRQRDHRPRGSASPWAWA